MAECWHRRVIPCHGIVHACTIYGALGQLFPAQHRRALCPSFRNNDRGPCGGDRCRDHHSRSFASGCRSLSFMSAPACRAATRTAPPRWWSGTARWCRSLSATILPGRFNSLSLSLSLSLINRERFVRVGEFSPDDDVRLGCPFSSNSIPSSSSCFVGTLNEGLVRSSTRGWTVIECFYRSKSTNSYEYTRMVQIRDEQSLSYKFKNVVRAACEKLMIIQTLNDKLELSLF